MKLKDLPIGELFTKKQIECPKDTQVFVRGFYDHSSKKYCCTRYSDISDSQLISGDKEVFIDFTF